MSDQVLAEHCISCGAEVRFVMTKTGRSMQLDAKPIAIVQCRSDGGWVVEGGHRPHGDTCPNAVALRKRGPK